MNALKQNDRVMVVEDEMATLMGTPQSPFLGETGTVFCNLADCPENPMVLVDLDSGSQAMFEQSTLARID